jgi:hypothetical protein
MKTEPLPLQLVLKDTVFELTYLVRFNCFIYLDCFMPFKGGKYIYDFSTCFNLPEVYKNETILLYVRTDITVIVFLARLHRLAPPTIPLTNWWQYFLEFFFKVLIADRFADRVEQM